MPFSFKGVTPSVFILGSSSPLCSLPDLELGSDNENRSWSASDFTLDKRVYLSLDANAITTIPFTNDQVISKSFDIVDQLESSDLDYFFIASTPNPQFTPGKTYQYEIEVQSNRNGSSFKLASGPDGMRVSNKGVVSWNVPRNFSEQEVFVIIEVTGPSGSETYESFPLSLKE